MSNGYLDQLRPHATEMLNKFTLDEIPKVDIIMLSVRPGLIGRIVSNINGQTVKLGKIVIILQGYTPQQADVLRQSIRNCDELILIHNDDKEVLLGARNNVALSHTVNEYIAIMDDDDVYYPNYMHSQMSYLLARGKPAIVSKINPIARDESQNHIGFIRNKPVEGYNQVGAGGSYVWHREVTESTKGFVNIQVGYDSKLMHAAYKLGYAILPGDPFNFIVTRGRPEGNTWALNKINGVSLNNIRLEEIIL